MSDAWADLNRRAAAVPGVPIDRGLVLYPSDIPEHSPCTCIQSERMPSGHVKTWSEDDDGILGVGQVWVPDLRSAATRGILRAALGSPGIEAEYVPGRKWWIVRLRWKDSFGLRTIAVRVDGEATREQAEAAALVALAKARGQWGPE